MAPISSRNTFARRIRVFRQRNLRDVRAFSNQTGSIISQGNLILLQLIRHTYSKTRQQNPIKPSVGSPLNFFFWLRYPSFQTVWMTSKATSHLLATPMTSVMRKTSRNGISMAIPTPSGFLMDTLAPFFVLHRKLYAGNKVSPQSAGPRLRKLLEIVLIRHIYASLDPSDSTKKIGLSIAWVCHRRIVYAQKLTHLFFANSSSSSFSRYSSQCSSP